MTAVQNGRLDLIPGLSEAEYLWYGEDKDLKQAMMLAAEIGAGHLQLFVHPLIYERSDFRGQLMIAAARYGHDTIV